MNHEEVLSRLPWYLAGSLDEAEMGLVRGHLDECAECRAELESTRVAARLFAAEHPAPAELVDAAWDRLDAERSAAVTAHLTDCPECREEVALASASRGTEHLEDDPATALPLTPAARRTPRRRWPLAVAACAVLVSTIVVLGVVRIRSGERRTLRAEMDTLRDQVASTRLATDRARKREAELEGRLGDLLAPRAGVPLVELLPESVLRGSPGSKIATVDRGAAPFALLVVALENPRRHPTFSARLVDADGKEHFVSSPAAADDTGALTLLVPTASLPLGSATLEVMGGAPDTATVVGRYRLSVRDAGGSQPKSTNGAQ
jgi:anti-sigma factor ChrR (cupin superfamily)